MEASDKGIQTVVSDKETRMEDSEINLSSLADSVIQILSQDLITLRREIMEGSGMTVDSDRTEASITAAQEEASEEAVLQAAVAVLEAAAVAAVSEAAADNYKLNNY